MKTKLNEKILIIELFPSDDFFLFFSSRLPTLKDPQSGESLSVRPTWLLKMQSFIKSRGVLADKRYIVEFEKTN
jgi:hypothetical protein